jgi:predicted phosphodiesterase
MTRLATFLHISDLHIGEFEAITGDSKISPLAARVLNNLPIFDGLLGHHAAALRHLEDFSANLLAEEPDCMLIVSGDLSRYGDYRELRSARALIESSVDIAPPLREQVGLYFHSAACLIPGNHDHWAGVATPIGAAPSDYSAVFFDQPTPSEYVLDLRDEEGMKLRFIRINSDADIQPNSLNRLLAKGHFTSELNVLSASLPARPDNEIRVLMIHHSRSHAGRVLAMTRASKQALDEFLKSKGISVMLTGHTHAPVARLHNIRGTSGVHELGAGSTTQFDVLPFKWKVRLRNPHQLGWHPNTLMVHRIALKDGQPWWETETCQRFPNGFMPVSHYSFPI